jgi:glucose 1-dehydrogenase
MTPCRCPATDEGTHHASCYAKRNLPEPAIPALKSLNLLKDQTALVTGANSGIGRAIALALGRAGANVIVNYVPNPADAEEMAE